MWKKLYIVFCGSRELSLWCVGKEIQWPFEILHICQGHFCLVNLLVTRIKVSVGLINALVLFSPSQCCTTNWTSTNITKKTYCSLYKQQCIQNSGLNLLKCLLFVHEVAFNDFDPARPRTREVYLFVQFCIASHVIRLQVWLLPAQLFAAEKQGDTKLVSSLLNPFSYLSYKVLRT